MKFLNIGIGEVIFILIIALIVIGPGNMVKTAREMGTFLRKVTKSPYWQEVWATRRELKEIPKMLAKEAQLEESVKDINRSTNGIRSTVTKSVIDFFKEGEEHLKEANNEQKSEPADFHKTQNLRSDLDLKENNES